MLRIQSSDSVTILSVDHEALVDALTKTAHEIRERNPHTIKIFLFGSFAKENYTPESDIDILIISKQMNVPFLQRADLFLDFFKYIPFDLNILVYTEDEIRKMLENGSTFIQSVMKEAKEL